MKVRTGHERPKTIYYKRNTSAFWEASDYVAKSNEVLIAEDTDVSKRGDGEHVWEELSAIGDNEKKDEQ